MPRLRHLIANYILEVTSCFRSVAPPCSIDASPKVLRFSSVSPDTSRNNLSEASVKLEPLNSGIPGELSPGDLLDFTCPCTFLPYVAWPFVISHLSEFKFGCWMVWDESLVIGIMGQVN